MRTVVSAAIIGVVATVVAFASWALGGASLTALEWAPYDRWLAERVTITPSPHLVVIARDAVSDTQLGAGSWDRAVHARLITELARAGAVAVAIDVPLGQRSVSTRGGASSDVMLTQATAVAGVVVYPVALEPLHDGAPAPAPERRPWPTPAMPPHRSWPSAPDALDLLATRPPSAVVPGLLLNARAVGHTLAPADADGVVRRAPLFVRFDDRAVPAFGLAIAAAAMGVPTDAISLERRRAIVAVPPALGADVAIPIDAQGRMLVIYAGHGRGLRSVPFSEVWTAIQAGHAERVQELVENRTVVALTEPAPADRHTADGRFVSDLVVQAHLADTILGRRWLREIPAAWTVGGTLLLAVLTAWLVLAARSWKGLLAAAALTTGYAGVVVIAPAHLGLVLPAWLPLSALVVAGGAALLWAHFDAGYRIHHLEDQIARVAHELGIARDALVRQESAVESLEDDLEAAQERAKTAEAVRAQLAEARREEEQTRGRLQQLERELRGLRAVDVRAGRLADKDDERLRRECAEMGIVTRDPAMLAIFRNLKKAARSSLPIMLLGEPGTGKELFARAAHRASPRAGEPFIAVNMAAISAELFESELFGHVRGAFTGAIGERRGFFELADRGTLFLDEIGEMRPDHQSKLLRVLQDKSFYRVGATRPSAVDVRVIAASNRDLDRGVADGWFREDLYFRLKGVVLTLPPLRERRADLPVLAGRFAEEAAREVERPGLRLSEDALAAIEAHEWKGNVRELQHAVRQAVALAEGDVVTVEDLRLAAPSRVTTPLVTGGGDDSDAAVLTCLRKHGFDMQATAADLGWDRSTVTQRLKGLGFRALVESGGDQAEAARALAGDPALVRVVELKLREYHDHLVRVIRGFPSADAAIAACRRRFKNLPERHFRSLESLVRSEWGAPTWPPKPPDVRRPRD